MGSQELSSGGEDDGDSEWRAAIDSVALDFGVSHSNGSKKSTHLARNQRDATPTADKEEKSAGFKLYQLKAHQLLHDLLDKSLTIVRNPIPALDDNPQKVEGGIRLFSGAPLGIIFDPVDTTPKQIKRPRIVGEEINEKSKKFKHRLQSVAVDGFEIMAAAKDAHRKSLVRVEAKDAARKEAAKKEEERVADLKKIRGERWLPSIAKEMQGSLVNGVGRN